ncbi:hypothetical protein C8F04DRAFT_1391709 [Mycena alexandri]|uniref:F-box domain-containing protein n=1 Tax=Mycena alexandri TaxID=1745969 RepID=A0AAD6T8U4_9AGAR|nr:hypothetical protein C8F04DRAFT_1391709 [Mycena alexandri]
MADLLTPTLERTTMSTSKPGGMGTLDAAILERIFNVLAPKKLAPHKRLVPLLRVNRHWRALVQQRLYTAISLKGQWVSRPLRKTLDKNPALAALVTELVMDTELSSQDPKETVDHMRIVAACPNIQHLTILGYASAEVEKYQAAIASRASLVTLNLSEGSGMFTFAQLLEMLPGWPKLEKLILKDTLLPSDSGAPVSATPGTHCPLLKMVKIIDTLDETKHFSFSAFAALAPSVSVFWVQPQRTMPADVIDALRIWASTLEALCLLSDSELHIETILPQLAALKHLDTWSQMLSPLSVKYVPPSVEVLTYRIFPAQLLDLSETLALPGVLPGLRALEVKGAIPPGRLTPMSFTPTATQSIRTVCKRRRIRLTM